MYDVFSRITSIRFRCLVRVGEDAHLKPRILQSSLHHALDVLVLEGEAYDEQYRLRFIQFDVEQPKHLEEVAALHRMLRLICIRQNKKRIFYGLAEHLDELLIFVRFGLSPINGSMWFDESDRRGFVIVIVELTPECRGSVVVESVDVPPKVAVRTIVENDTIVLLHNLVHGSFNEKVVVRSKDVRGSWHSPRIGHTENGNDH